MKVLLVDDDPDLRELLSNILKTKGFETVPVETGAAALARIESPDIDVALIDLKLEDMNGMEVLRGIKERSADTECILLTGYASQATAIEAINLGAYAYFQKPYDVDQLLVAVQRAAEKRIAEQALVASESRYRLLLEASTDSIYVLDREWRHTLVNHAAEIFTGFPKEKLLGARLTDLFPGIEHTSFFAVFQRVMETRVSDIVSAEYAFADGRTGYYEVRVSPVPEGILCISRDVTTREQAEKELSEMAERLRLANKATNDVIWDWDIIHDTQRWNEAGTAVFGWTEIVERPVNAHWWVERVHPDDRERVHESFFAVVNNPEIAVWHNEYRFVKADGDYAEVMDRGYVLRDKQGKAIRMIGAMQDITERKRAEDALGALEERFRLAAQNASDLIWEWNIVNGKLEWFGAVDALLGYAPGEFPRTIEAWKEIIHADDRDRVAAALDQHLKTRALYAEEYRVCRKDGTFGYWTDKGEAIWDDRGNACKMIGVCTDITEHKQAEEALRLSEERHRLISEVISDYAYSGMIFPNGSLRTDWISGAFEQISGYTVDEMQALPLGFASLVLPEDLENVFRQQHLLFEEKWLSVEYRIRKKNGEIRWLFDHMTLAPGKMEGEGQKIFGAVQDITERKQVEEALQLSEEKYRALVDEINDGFYATDGAGVFTFANPALARMYGFDSPEALVGRKFTDFVMPEMQAELGQAYGGAMQNGHTPEVVNGRIVRTDGTHAFVEIKSVFMIEAGQIAGSRGVMRDITKRKHAEEALLENEKKVKRLLEQQIAINQLALALGESLNLKDVYHTICERLRGLVDVWCFIISSYDEQAREICAEYVESEEIYDVSGFPRIPLGEPGQGTQSRVIHTGQPLYTPDHQQAISTSKVRYTIEEDGSVHEELPSEKEEENTTRSVVYLPMKIEGKTVGIMQVQSTRLDAYSQEDITLLAGMANVAAVATQNARLFQEVQRELAERKQAEEALHERLAELELLYQSGLALSQLLNPKEIGQKIIELLEQKLAWHHTAIRLYHPQNETLELLAFNQPGLQDEAEHRRVEERFNALISKVGDGLSGWAVQNLQTIRSSDLSHDPRYMETFPGLHSGLYVPMKLGDRAIGVISIESEQPNAFSEADERLVATLASQSASALENARLFEETRQRMTELETLNLISVALRAVLDREKMLAIVLEETLNALNAKNGSINLWNPETDEISQVIARGWLAGLADFSVKPGEGIFGKVFASGKPHVSMEFTGDPQTLEQSRPLLPPGWGGACVPIRSSEQVLGVFVVAVPSTRRFNQNELRLLNTLSEMAGSALYRMTLNEETLRRLRYLESLRVVDRAIAGSLDHRVTLNILLDQVISQLGLDAADVLLLNIPLQTLQFGAGQGFHTSMNKSASVRVGESFAGRAVLERCIVRVEDGETARENPSFFKFWSDEGFSRYYAVPLIAKGQVKGALEVFKRTPFTPDSDWFNFLETLASQAAIAIDNAQLFENLQNTNLDLTLAYDATIEGWSRAMDLRDEETEGHTQRVTTMAVNLAQAFGLNDDELLLLRRGALLHDIGKIGVPDHILLKPGKLTEPEWEIMRKHPQFAYEMLQPIAYLRGSLDIPHCHHEKWDGTGYPQGLKGEQIPLAARIFAIVDVYDALTSDRPYRKAWTKAKTLKHIREQSGTHFDPQVVEKFMDHWEKKR